MPQYRVKMNRTLLLIFAIAFAAGIRAGDTPCSSTFLSGTSTIFASYSNAGNSDSGIAAPPFGGYMGSDIWFSFVMPASGSINLIIKEGGLLDPALAVYSGDCNDPKLLYNVVENNCDGSISPSISFTNLVPGELYYIRIWAENGTGDGDFDLYLNNSPNPNPQFLLHSDATDLGDCIQLTGETNSQQGCTWFELPIDFTEPFTHNMTVNFGNKDAAGADGICLIYQSNGPDFCGGSGGGIGAEGMPNSAIFEFDTWQNGSKNDPFQDHSSFNINGDMDHNNSINGPVNLGNIEDGADHTITFIYDGVGGYTLLFDGAVILSGSFDFINNCFGGSETAYWGYTSSTGASNNLHTVCPDFEEFLIGTQEYIEVDLCEGDSYNGYTDPGFYIDYVGGIGNCVHQINTQINVYPVSDPTFIEKTICEGEVVIVNDQAYGIEDLYEINTLTSFGCDSTIILDLKVIEMDLGLANDILDCNNETIIINSFLTTNHPEASAAYNWSGPEGGGSDEFLEVGLPGAYTLSLDLVLNGVICSIEATAQVNIDTLAPIVTGLEDIELSCDTMANPSHLIASGYNYGNNTHFVWSENGNEQSGTPTYPINGEGLYGVTVTNLDNGCYGSSEAVVTFSDNRPHIEADHDTITCNEQIIILEGKSNTADVTFNWFNEQAEISSSDTVSIQQPGNYTLFVTDVEGCISSQNVTVYIDTIAPLITISDLTIPCDTQSITTAFGISDSTHLYTWGNSSGVISNSFNTEIMEGGPHRLEIIDPNNGCSAYYTFIVNKLGNSPMTNITGGQLDCNNDTLHLEVETDQTDANFEWFFESTLIGNQTGLTISDPGTYALIATSIKGCLRSDSIDIPIDTLYPTLTIQNPDSIDCDQLTVSLDINAIDYDLITWAGPIVIPDNTTSPSTNTPGTYHITVINTVNGCMVSDSTEVISKEVIPIYQLGSDTISCLQDSIYLPFEITSPYNFVVWNGPASFSSSVVSPIAVDTGWYNLHIEVDGNCDVDTSLYIIGDLVEPTFSLSGNDITCESPLTDLVSDYPCDQLQTEWTLPDGSNVYSEVLTASLPGLYSLSIMGPNGCIGSDDISIGAFLDPPSTTLQKTGDITCVLPHPEIFSSNTAPNINHDWFGPDYEIVNQNRISAGQKGVYGVILTNEHFCKQEYSITIDEFLTSPVFDVAAEAIDCNNPIATIGIDTDDTSLTYKLEGPDGWTSMGQDITTGIPGIYTVTAENQYGCTEVVTIDIEDQRFYPTLRLRSPDTIIVDEDNINNTIDVDIETEGDYDLTWTPDEGLSCSACLTPSLDEYYQPYYQLVAVNEYGCEDDIEVFVRKKIKPVELHVPNIISVNGDGNNDGFTIYGDAERITYIESLLIYDRWGNQVFAGKELEINNEDQGWKGMFNNKAVEQGVYVFYATVLLTDETRINLGGDITVVR